MKSRALQALEKGVEEVDHLLLADPTPRGGLSPQPEVTRAVIRAAIVLLCGHFERYIRAVSEEAVGAVNREDIRYNDLSVDLRLQHSRIGIDQLIERKWESRETALMEFVNSDSWLWADVPKVDLIADRLLTWLKSPKPERLRRVFRLWGIDDIFSKITRKPTTRGEFWLRVKELVEKRNNIAHGDFTVEATRSDVKAYQKVVREFCRRADAALERALETHVGIAGAWQQPA